MLTIAAGKEILTREFTVTTVDAAVQRRDARIRKSAGGHRLGAHGVRARRLVLDQRIATDIEEFWDHYQKETLPKVFQHVMARSHGELRPEFAPPFDTLKIDIHMSEPNYELGIDKERISSLEALQEDTFYSTENFVNMMGDLEAGRAITYVGRIIPIVHASDDGKDGHVHIEFYAKPAGNPLVELAWTDAQGKRHAAQARSVGPARPDAAAADRGSRHGARVRESLTWLLPADFKDDKFDEWIKLEGEDQVERGIFPVEQARGQLHWLDAMHAAGLYKDELAYPHLQQMAFEFELPLPLDGESRFVPRRANTRA